ncbi:MAG: hypothetical protein ACP5IT_03010 [Thermoproteota archaeon]|jgi:hypothetical protein
MVNLRLYDVPQTTMELDALAQEEELFVGLELTLHMPRTKIKERHLVF